MIQSLGQEVNFVDGLRVTTAENLKVAEMVLSGNLNKEIIAHLQTFGGKAVGLSGKDGNLIQVTRKARKWYRSWLCRHHQTDQSRTSAPADARAVHSSCLANRDGE